MASITPTAMIRKRTNRFTIGSAVSSRAAPVRAMIRVSSLVSTCPTKRLRGNEDDDHPDAPHPVPRLGPLAGGILGRQRRRPLPDDPPQRPGHHSEPEGLAQRPDELVVEIALRGLRQAVLDPVQNPPGHKVDEP